MDSRRTWGIAVMIAMLIVVAAMATSALRRDRQSLPVDAVARWNGEIGRLDAALVAGDRAGAHRAWSEAWSAALASRRWDAFIRMGDASLRLGDLDGHPATARARARQAYLLAMFRARAAGSIEGVLRAAEGFAGLGDRDVVNGALHLAIQLAADAPEVRADVEIVAADIVARMPGERALGRPRSATPPR